MTIASFLKIPTALPVAAMLALAGCGGSNSGGTATGPGGNGNGADDGNMRVMATPAHLPA